MKITYHGHSVVMMEDKDFKAIIDPFLTGNGLCNITVDDINELSHIFITHGHGDHIGDTVALARKTGALVIANHEISAYLASKGVEKIHAMHLGGRTTFDFGVVKMTNAIHGSGITDDGKMIEGGNPGGFIIEVNNNKIYHAGDTGLTYDMKLLEDEHIDLAFLPIGGNFTMDVNDAVKAVKFIKPKAVTPIHYKTFPIVNADPEEFKKKVKDSEVIVIDFNESIEME